jgi:hypothetical protein
LQRLHALQLPIVSLQGSARRTDQWADHRTPLPDCGARSGLDSDGILPHCIQPDTKESIMKVPHLITAVMGAAALAATSAFAGSWDSNPDTAGGILEDLDRPGYVGTSLPDARAAFPNRDVDETGNLVGAAGPEQGQGDLYGSILFDVGALR